MSDMPANAAPLAEESAASLVSFVVDSIVDGVMKGRYAPGQRLIAADLAEEYQVSRAPVREALHVLAGEGVVELIANRGARIRRLSVKELVDFLEFTEAILVLGVRLVTARMNEPDCRAVIAAAQLELEGSRDRGARDFVFALYQYHVGINMIAGNEFLEFFYRRPYIRFYTLLLADLVPGDHADQFVINYRMITESILSGDAHTSVTMFVSHIRWVLRNMRAEGRS
ncbi:GntR family transcriptional regulator [Rhizorhabdus wittichii]|uniref:GntR family transcriptional regulator n=1 Tax=Rhizorhabdus wittichii TaxID=160791 RepID=A0A975HCE7_9SPHN|nr:GntR family transcriptional regulator [Rhizorhabdus wittichii]QTH20172.1 GntR family transcriptional regulator [Rhizorhabdus wittichii]